MTSAAAGKRAALPQRTWGLCMRLHALHPGICSCIHGCTQGYAAAPRDTRLHPGIRGCTQGYAAERSSQQLQAPMVQV